MSYIQDLKTHFRKDNHWPLNYYNFIKSYNIENIKEFHKDITKLGLIVTFKDIELVIQIKEGKNEKL